MTGAQTRQVVVLQPTAPAGATKRPGSPCLAGRPVAGGQCPPTGRIHDEENTPLSGTPAADTLALALGSSLLLQPTAQAETLREAVGIALGQHPQVLGARRNAEAIRHEVTGAANAMNTRFGVIAEPSVGYTRGQGRDRRSGDLGAQAIKPIYDAAAPT